jgi:arylsulfatase A-like enzyme
MNKAALCMIIIFFLVFAACKTPQAVLDLKEESVYAHKQADIFAVDLLHPEGEEYVMGGWSAVRKDGTRLGVFPVSRLSIHVFDKKPLYLFFNGVPFLRDQIPAKGLLFRLKNKDVAQFELVPEEEKPMRIALNPEDLEIGKNVLQIFHDVEEEKEADIDPEKNRRIRTVVFDEMILSSHPDYEISKKYLETKRRLDSEGPEFLIQKVPSTLDFYVPLPADGRLEVSFEFVASDPSGELSPGPLAITVLQEGREEESLFRVPIKGDKNTGKATLDLPAGPAETRLRFQAGDIRSQGSFEGLLIWKKASILTRPAAADEKTKQNGAFLNWKKSLADKNTVLIILDAARADHFSSYGYYRPTTPRLDKFADQAILFTQAYSEALTTRASMGTLFTGFPLTVLSLYSITSRIPEELTTLAQMFRQKDIKTTGFAGVGNVSSSFGFDRGFDQYFELYREEEFYRKSQEYLPYLLPWLEANIENQFFLYVHFKEPHAAYSPLPPFKGMFTNQYDETIDLSVHLNPIADSLTEEQIEFVRAGYDENLASVDSVVGEMLDKMESLGILEESVIIVTADHGELLGEIDKIFGHGGYFGEGGMHIPLLIRFPETDEIKYPSRVDALVKTSDLLATLADIHGFTVQENLLSGKSLLSLVADPDAEINAYMVAEKRGIPGYCYRTKKHKLIYWMDNAPLEFYDLEKDPEAMRNIFEQNKIVAYSYLAKLKKWIVSQKLIKEALLKGDPSKRDLDMKQIDEKTLENLKALGYIK